MKKPFYDRIGWIGESDDIRFHLDSVARTRASYTVPASGRRPPYYVRG